jgi:hypothetical protein
MWDAATTEKEACLAFSHLRAAAIRYLVADSMPDITRSLFCRPLDSPPGEPREKRTASFIGHRDFTRTSGQESYRQAAPRGMSLATCENMLVT